jgi:3-oxoacyl-(acyl-carrier-protein) synthase
MKKSRKIVVTGLGAISPAGVGTDLLWTAARDGKTFGGKPVSFDVSQNNSQIAAELTDFNPRQHGISEDQLERMDRVVQFSYIAAKMAIRDANLTEGNFDPNRTGVLIGTAIGGVKMMEEVFGKVCIRNNGKPETVNVIADLIHPNIYGGFLAHSVSSEIALMGGFKGVCTTMATGCTAGIDAIGTAYDLIANGMADVMITGGAEAPLTPIVMSSFDNINCLTRRNDSPNHSSRPFDRDRDGFLLAEGCGILVLETEEHAKARGAKIYGQILGYASLSNAFHMTSLPSDGEALAVTLEKVLKRAGIASEEVDYINAHGSSTQQNDVNETAAFKTVFGKNAYKIPISSNKSVVGHSLGAASAVESVICFKAIEEGVVPPTANYETPDPRCDLDYVPNHPRKAELNVVECNASGFSGIHSAILYGSAEV